MIVHKTGNLFDTELTSIAHGVNVDGVMGAGIAKTVRALYPVTYETYRNACKTGVLKPGKIHVWYENGRFVYNLASQDRPGPNAKLKWLEKSLDAAIVHAKKSNHAAMAVPRIGAGIGGLDWDDVLELMTALSEKHDFTLEIWTYNG